MSAPVPIKNNFLNQAAHNLFTPTGINHFIYVLHIDEIVDGKCA